MCKCGKFIAFEFKSFSHAEEEKSCIFVCIYQIASLIAYCKWEREKERERLHFFSHGFVLIKCSRNIIKNPLNSSIYAYTFVCILLELLVKQQHTHTKNVHARTWNDFDKTRTASTSNRNPIIWFKCKEYVNENEIAMKFSCILYLRCSPRYFHFISFRSFFLR